ncbi:MAG: hypothetical protein EXQ85_09630 [Alphaproteobacteria bacterium]|nr:hypothetical protein [Alphaproteobacteria bacterium]
MFRWLLTVLMAASLLAGIGVKAAETATLSLTASVAQLLAIAVTPTAAATNLNLSVTQVPLKIATVVATANRASGYTVSVSSANVASANCTAPCFYSSTLAQRLAFALYRGSTSLSFTAGNATFVQTAARLALGGDNYDAAIEYDGATANLPAGTDYSETLTFSIAVH